MSRCMLGRTGANRPILVVDTEGPSMRFPVSIFGRLLEPINRRQFQAVVDGPDVQKLGASGGADLCATEWRFRGLVAGFNPNSQHH